MNIFRILIVASVMLMATLLFGCSENADFKLLRNDISLTIGESRNLLPYVGFSAVSEKTIKLSTDSDCVEISGASVTAVKPGTAAVNVTAQGKSVAMNITVLYRNIHDFTVTAENCVQTANGNPQPVVFTAALDGYVDPQTAVQWKVNDITHSGASFEFTPPGYGEYTVTATVGDIVKQYGVKVYRRTVVQVNHTNLNNVQAYTPLVFTAYENVNTLNPQSVYEWRVNDEKASDSPILNFTPEVGEYRVSLFVNGEAKNIDGKSEVTVSVARDNATDCSVDFDDAEGVYIRWASERRVLFVSIVDPDGNREIFDVTDAQHAHLFSDGAFRATEYIDVCAQNPAQYNITIGTDRGKHELVFTQLPAVAKQYLDKNVLCNNSFISSADDARMYVDELYATGKSEAVCYIAADAQSMEAVIKAQAERLGLTVTTSVDGNVMSLSFLPYVNKPSKSESVSVNSTYTALPHIEYSDNNHREKEYIFASDRLTRSIAVSGTEQLLIAISRGFKPVTQNGDVAQTVYRAAKSILLRIVGTDYTVQQKVHAIYDWLQWVTVNIDSAAAESASRYLEGIFTAQRAPGSGYAVTSDGMAKALSLLCGIEGITCELHFDSDYGYYNKVRLDGLWYNVDAFGGKAAVHAAVGTTVELMSHRGLLITDAQLEELGCAVNDGREAFAVTDVYFMNKHSDGAEYFDYYIDKSEVSYEAVRTAVYHAFAGTMLGNVSIPFVGSVVQIYNNTYGVELALDERMTDEEVTTVTGYITRAIDEYADKALNATFASRRMVAAGNVICASASSPRVNTNS